MVSWGVNFPHKNGSIALWVAFHMITSESPPSILKSYKYDNYDKTTYNPANICWSWRRLQHVFSVTILCLARRLQSVLEDEKLLHWRRLQDVLNTCLEEVLKTLWTQTKYIMGISVSNKPKCVSNKSIFYISMFDNSKTKPKGIN